MPVQSVYNQALGQHLVIGGRRVPTALQQAKVALKFEDYLPTGAAAPPPAPPVIDYYSKAASALRQMYMNDQLGCCVEAAIAHLEGVFTANSNRPLARYSNTGIVQMYGAMGGYVPGNPATDLGTDEVTAMTVWALSGAPRPPHQIAGAMTVNPANAAHYRQALHLFENLLFGFPLALEWFPNVYPGFVWDAPCHPNPSWQHCVAGVGTNREGIVVSTWGMTGTFTDRAISAVVQPQYYGQLYVVLSEEIILRGMLKSPTGLNWTQLCNDFNALGGNIVV
jgi:hypothetical protein